MTFLFGDFNTMQNFSCFRLFRSFRKLAELNLFDSHFIDCFLHLSLRNLFWSRFALQVQLNFLGLDGCFFLWDLNLLINIKLILLRLLKASFCVLISLTFHKFNSFLSSFIFRYMSGLYYIEAMEIKSFVHFVFCIEKTFYFYCFNWVLILIYS